MEEFKNNNILSEIERSAQKDLAGVKWTLPPWRRFKVNIDTTFHEKKWF